jgi:uncharacterized alpha-E superfamily protein
MPLQTGSRRPQKASAIAQRLRAHARLCEQIAQETQSEETAATLKRMADDCTRVAAQIAQEDVERDNPPPTCH